MQSAQLIRLAVIFAYGSLSTSATGGQREDWAAAGVRFGASILGVIAKDAPPETLPSALPASSERSAIDNALASYSEMKAADAQTLGGGQAATNFLIDGTAATIVGVTGGTGTIGAVVFKGAAQAGSDALFEGLRKDSEQQLKMYLANQGATILRSSGLEDLIGNEDASTIKTRLTDSGVLIRDMQSRLPNDLNIQGLATDLLIKTLEDTNKAELTTLAHHEANFTVLNKSLGNVGKKLDALADDTDQQLKDQNEHIDAVQAGIESLGNTVTDLDQRIASDEKLSSFVADYVFDQLPASKKVLALKNGTFDEHFSCADASTNCDAAVAKQDLINKFENEEKIDHIRETTTEIVAGAEDIKKIADNLGVQLPPAVGTGIQFAQVAEAAFSDVMTGNFLGAAVAVTGLFQHKGPDPTMQFMSQHFARIESQLKTVLEKQVVLEHKIDILSEKLEDHFSQLNARLDHIERSIEEIHSLVVAQNQLPWLPCNEIYIYASSSPIRYDYDLTEFKFKSVHGIYQMIEDVGESISKCRSTTQERVLGLFQPNWFGNFLDIDEITLNTTSSDRQYVKDIHTKVIDILGDYISRHQIAWPSVLKSLISPAVDLRQLDQKIATFSNRAIGCEEGDAIASGRLWFLVCSQGMPSDISAKLLSVATEPDFAVDMARWSLVSAPVIDAYEAYEKEATFDAASLLHYAKTHPGAGPGRLVLSAAAISLDYSLANLAVMEGDLTVEAVYEIIVSKPGAAGPAEQTRLRLHAEAIDALRADRHLANNVAMRYLQRHYGLWDFSTKSKVADVNDDDSYWTSKDIAQFSASGDVFASLRTLFGFEADFGKIQNGAVALVFSRKPDGSIDAAAQLPERANFYARSLSYSKTVADLIAERNRLHERLHDYDLISTLKNSDGAALASVVARGAYQPSASH